MRLSHDPLKISASFDDPNLVSRAGLVPVMSLAERAGLGGLVRRHVQIAAKTGVYPEVKVACLVAGMAAGADSIDDMDLLRHGAMPDLFGGVRAPSTLGAFLRSFTWGDVRQLEKAGRELLAGLARAAPLLPGADQLAFVDVDSMQRRVYGHKKQGAAFGHTKISGKTVLVRGLNALAAAICTPQAAPVIAGTRLRGGSANTARGAASFTGEAISTARAAGCTATIVARADSGLYCAAFARACRRNGAYFSVTARMDPAVKRAIASIPGGAWTPVRYPRAIWDDQLRAWVSDAEVAEIPYTAFASKKGQAITARLIVRRVRDQNRKAVEGMSELFPVWRYTRHLHRLPVRDDPGRGAAPRPRHRGTAVRRLGRRPDGSPALRLVCRQRRLADLGCDHSQPGPRCRVPGLGSPRPGPRRHHPPRPDRRCGPRRPPRPRPPGLAPARILAPQGRMAQPVRGGLRPAAGPGGLTSPRPRSPRPHGQQPRHPPPRTPVRFPDKPQTGERRDPPARENNKITITEARIRKMITQSCTVD